MGVLTPTYNKEGTNEDRVMVMDFRYSIGGKDTSPNGLELLICDTSAETYGIRPGVAMYSSGIIKFNFKIYEAKISNTGNAYSLLCNCAGSKKRDLVIRPIRQKQFRRL